MQETWVRSLGWGDPLEESMATHSSILAWKTPVDRGAWWAAVHGVTKSQVWLYSTLGSTPGLLLLFAFTSFINLWKYVLVGYHAPATSRVDSFTYG